jgi:adenylyltransferase/sulfurtransferase
MGGLGSPVSLYLAAAGVGKLGLVDGDSVDRSNLQRQVLYTEADVGLKKVEAAASRLRALNSEVEIETYADELNAQNAVRIAQGYDIILDGTDQFSAKFLINDLCHQLGKPWVYGSVNQFEGQVGLFQTGASADACYRCLVPRPPQTPIQNCAQAGVLGSAVGVIGTVQATLALNRLVSGGDPNHPLDPRPSQLQVLELGGHFQSRTVQVRKRPDCETCSISPASLKLQDAMAGCGTAHSGNWISPQELVSLRFNSHPVHLIDVREEEEWSAGRIEGALHWPLARVEQGDLPRLVSPDVPLIFYCHSGLRSQRAAEKAHSLGVQNARSLQGGIVAWNTRGDSV